MSAAAPDARLGASPVDSATRFEVWAPDAERVEVVLDSGVVVALRPFDGDGDRTWVGTADGVGHGDHYRIRLDGGDPLPDPASRHQPDGVHGSSAVVDPRRFTWTDDDWTGLDLTDTILYELHIGTFTRDGTFDAAIGGLDRLVELGVTAIELMPVNAFPGRHNWGYDGVFVSAVQASYGGPEGLARLVDAAHARRLAVVLDVVYNHLGPEGNVLARFAPFFTDSYTTPWGPAVNVAEAGSDQVRRLFIESATGFVGDFHIDGLRLDAIHAIVDPTARPFVQELSESVHAVGETSGRRVLVTAESSANDPRVVLPAARHGFGCDAVWDDDVHHALRVALTGEQHEYYADYDGVEDLADALEHRWVLRGRRSTTRGRRHGAPVDDVDHRRFIVFAQNHDHVGNTPRGERLLHDAGPGDPRLRLAAATVLLSPFTPLLFMGEEYAERAPFPYFVDHGDPELVDAVRTGRQEEFAGLDWSDGIADPGDPATAASAVLDPAVAEHTPHAGLVAWYTELIRVRRMLGVLTTPDAAQRVVRQPPEGAHTILLERSHDGSLATLVLHFGDEPVLLESIARGLGRELEADELVLDSSDPVWGTTGGPLAADAVAPWSARLYVAGR